jgi:hypothetical protein
MCRDARLMFLTFTIGVLAGFALVALGQDQLLT